MVTVMKFMVTSVTVTVSRLVNRGVQGGPVDEPRGDGDCPEGAAGCSRERQHSFTWWIRCFAECFNLPA